MKDGLLNEKKCGYIYSKNKILPLLKKYTKTIIEKHKTRFPSPNHNTYKILLFICRCIQKIIIIYIIHNHKQIHKIKHYIQYIIEGNRKKKRKESLLNKSM